MKLLSFEKIVEANISPQQCYDWVCETLAHKSESILPAKISLKPGLPGVFYNTMPAIIPKENIAGVKLVTRYPERSPSLDSEILLYDLKTGKNLALVDGNWITAMRTGAVAAHSIRLLAVPDFSVLGFIGLGNTARAAMDVLLSLYPEREMTVKLKKYKNQHELFAARFADHPNVHFVYCDTFAQVICDTQVVVSAATVFEQDLCPDDCYGEGVLVVPIHTRGFTNCDLFFDRVYADDVNQVKDFRYFDRFRSFGEIADVVRGKIPGRCSDRERILAYNIGIALHDIYFSGKLYNLIGESCEDVSLNPPTEKFWV